MVSTKADNKPDVEAVKDRGERTALMEPLIRSEGSRHRVERTDLALELAQRSAGLRRSLPPSPLSSLATPVRAMNCYYSNLIEGHDTHPIDIERALREDYSRDAKKRDLQIEAKAHVVVQQWIDESGYRVAPSRESPSVRFTVASTNCFQPTCSESKIRTHTSACRVQTSKTFSHRSVRAAPTITSAGARRSRCLDENEKIGNPSRTKYSSSSSRSRSAASSLLS